MGNVRPNEDAEDRAVEKGQVLERHDDDGLRIEIVDRFVERSGVGEIEFSVQAEQGELLSAIDTDHDRSLCRRSRVR